MIIIGYEAFLRFATFLVIYKKYQMVINYFTITEMPFEAVRFTVSNKFKSNKFLSHLLPPYCKICSVMKIKHMSYDT